MKKSLSKFQLTKCQGSSRMKSKNWVNQDIHHSITFASGWREWSVHTNARKFSDFFHRHRKRNRNTNAHGTLPLHIFGNKMLLKNFLALMWMYLVYIGHLKMNMKHLPFQRNFFLILNSNALKTDTCTTCDRLHIKVKVDGDFRSVKRKETHLQHADKAKRLMHSSMRNAQLPDSEELVASMDLQKVLFIPTLTHTQIYYSRQFSVCAWNNIHRLPPQGPNYQQWLLHCNIGAFEEGNHKKTAPFEKEKVLFHNAPAHKSMKTMAKLHELGYELLPHPPYSPDLASSDFFLFADLKRMLSGKKFQTNEEVIAEIEVEAKVLL